MTLQSAKSGFEFVVQDPKERFSKETQTKIRKQAMRAVGARRRLGGSKSPSPTAVSKPQRPRKEEEVDIEGSLVPMPLSGIELLIKDRGLNPIDLSALASVHIGAMLVTTDPGYSRV